MKFTKAYLDYVEKEIEVSETELHSYFESALEDADTVEDVAWVMAREIYNDYDDDDYHDDTIGWGDCSDDGGLLDTCRKYVEDHMDEFNARVITDGRQILLFDPTEYER